MPSITACGVFVRSLAQSLIALRIPCGVPSLPNSLASFDGVDSLNFRQVTDGNTSPAP